MVRKSLASVSPNDPETVNKETLSFKVGKIELKCAVTRGDNENL